MLCCTGSAWRGGEMVCGVKRREQNSDGGNRPIRRKPSTRSRKRIVPRPNPRRPSHEIAANPASRKDKRATPRIGN